MKEIVEYIVMGDAGIKELIEKVNRKISEGYQPLGGIAERDMYVTQAMVKYKAEE